MPADQNRVLIADDDERPRQLLEHYLKSWGYQVVACRDGLEAVALLEADNGPSLAMIDWKMPGLEGVEICRRIRGTKRQNGYTYIILVTGQSDAAAGLEAGADDFVSKPYNVDELRARLQVGQRVVGLERRLGEHIGQLRDALDQIAQLPDAGAAICRCPDCLRVHDAGGDWQPVEKYVATHATSEMCPDCRQNRDRRAPVAPAAVSAGGLDAKSI